MPEEKTHLDYLEETRRELHKGIGHYNPEDVKKLISLESALGLFEFGSLLSSRDLPLLTDMFLPSAKAVNLSVLNLFEKNSHIGILCSTNNSGNLEIAAVDFTDLAMNPKAEQHHYRKHNIGYMKDFKGYLNYAALDNLNSHNPKEHLNFLIGKILPSLVETFVSNFQKQAEESGHLVWRWERYTVEKKPTWAEYVENGDAIQEKNENALKSLNASDRIIIGRLAENLGINFMPIKTELKYLFPQEIKPLLAIRKLALQSLGKAEKISSLTKELKEYNVVNVDGEGDSHILCQLVRNYRRNPERIAQVLSKNADRPVEVEKLQNWIGVLYEVKPEFMSDFFKDTPALNIEKNAKKITF